MYALGKFLSIHPSFWLSLVEGFILVAICPEKIVQKIQYAECTHQPVKSLQMIVIQIRTREPWFVFGTTCRAINYGNNHGA